MSIEPKRWAEIRKLADDLIASCDGGMDELDEIEALTLDECKALDAMAFRCNGCDQWYDINERHDHGSEFYCDDCKTETV